MAEIAGRDEELTVEICVPCFAGHETSAVLTAENMKNEYKLTAVRIVTNVLVMREHQAGNKNGHSNGAYG